MRVSLTLFELSSVKSSWSESSLKYNTAFKVSFEKKRGTSERWCHNYAGCACVQALAVWREERAKMLGESDRERKLHDTSSASLTERQNEVSLFQGTWKRQDESFKGL